MKTGDVPEIAAAIAAYRAKKKKSYQHDYYIANRDRLRESNRQWRERNREHIREYRKRWEAERREKKMALRKAVQNGG